MNGQSRQLLLAPDDPPPVRIFNPAGRSSFLLIGDHAGNVIPSALGTLGLNDDDRARHIAWDIGIGALGPLLAKALDAVFISQTYSRLIVDCNRDPAAADVIADVSDGTAVPGNQTLLDEDRAARFAEIYEPYHQAIAAELLRRNELCQATILVALHSFTPIMDGSSRPWQIGVLHDRGDTAFAQTILQALRARGDLIVGDNEPYAMDSTDYTVPRHAYSARHQYVELELRQDLLVSDRLRDWTAIIAETLLESVRRQE